MVTGTTAESPGAISMFCLTGTQYGKKTFLHTFAIRRSAAGPQRSTERDECVLLVTRAETSNDAAPDVRCSGTEFGITTTLYARVVDACTHPKAKSDKLTMEACLIRRGTRIVVYQEMEALGRNRIYRPYVQLCLNV